MESRPMSSDTMDSTATPPTPTLRTPHTTHLHSPTTRSPLLVLTRTARPSFLPYYVLFLTFLVCAFLLSSLPRWPTTGSPPSLAALLSRHSVAPGPTTPYEVPVGKGGNFGDPSGDGKATMNNGEEEFKEEEEEEKKKKKGGWLRKMKGCDLYEGRWVRDEGGGGGYPLYGQGSCPFIDEAFDCFGNGRRDSGYAMYRWKPFGCDVPR